MQAQVNRARAGLDRAGVRSRGASIKLWWILLAFFSGVAVAMAAEELVLSEQENQLHFTAPGVHFLAGRPLERLHNAAEVPFDFRVDIAVGSPSRLYRRTAGRFVISYDLWEETFQVSRITPSDAGTTASISHLTAAEAEQWCLEQMAVDVSGLPANERLWAHMEIRAMAEQDSRGLFGAADITESGISLNGLIEFLSRPPRPDQPSWTLEAGPVTLEQLRQRGA